MTGRTLVARSLRFHWRSHLGVLLGATLSAAILVGALAVGDSVRYSLRALALARLGNTQLALSSQEKFFRAELADAIASDLKADTAPLILLSGTAATQPREGGDGLRAGHVQVIGVTEAFWKLGKSEGEKGRRGEGEAEGTGNREQGTEPITQLPNYPITQLPNTQHPTPDEGVILNDRLAATIGAKVGDDVLLRVDKPALLSRDAPLSTVADASVPIRLPVTAIIGDDDFGRFSLAANQVPPLNAFVPLELLQKQVAMRGRANVLLVGGREGKAPASSDATSALWKHWQFADAGLELRELPQHGVMELRTDRVFLDPPVAEAAMKAQPGAQGILTYFVNELRLGNRSTPYSTVAAIQGTEGTEREKGRRGEREKGRKGEGENQLPNYPITQLPNYPTPNTQHPTPFSVPSEMRDDEILVNSWLADDLGAKPGDKLTLTYWVMGPMRRLKEQSSVFRVRGVVPLEGAAADPDLMPPIPGLADKKNCREWEPGVPVDLKKIRDKDQDYWAAHRGTPKAFITLHAGQQIWNNRFGNLTAVRYPLSGPSRGTVEACIRQALSPGALGLFFVPVREQALAASSQSQDFGELFLGFSFFLIVAALLLMALLFALGVEQRAEEVGTLLAVGFPPRKVQRLLLLEGGALALIASVIGTGLAVLYTQAVIRGLTTVWQGAVANTALRYHAEPTTLLIGAVSGFLVALLAIWLVARRQARVPARELLSLGAETEGRSPGVQAFRRSGVRALGVGTGLLTLVLCVVGALVMVFSSKSGDHEAAAEQFFEAGALLLIGGIAACRLLMARMERGAAIRRLTLGALGVRNMARRRGRSLSAIALLASGSFLVIAVGANRQDAQDGALKRESGTGGFALYGETTLPVYQDLNSAKGQEDYNLDAASLQGVTFVPMRLKQGDEASCLNLNRAQTPSLLGVQPETLRSRKAFTFTQLVEKGDEKDPWGMLERARDDGTIPVVGDTNTVVWSLGKSVGAIVPYQDDRGNTLKLRIVGVLANSVLQGHLLVAESVFITHFPSSSGYRVFLLDAPPTANLTAIRKALTSGLEDVGPDFTPAVERLAAFNTVENTYLSIFALLGGLGLLLGSFGLGVVVLRNVLERRGELALLRAVGFRKPSLHWLLFCEHALLLSLGLAVGVVAALVAVLPALRAPGTETPFLSLALTLGAVFVSGFLWTWGATTLALRGPLLPALRKE